MIFIRTTFINFLCVQPKNEKSRSIIVKGLTEGINIPSLRFPVLSKEITEHLFILSAMYDLDELVALNLLRMGKLNIVPIFGQFQSFYVSPQIR